MSQDPRGAGIFDVEAAIVTTSATWKWRGATHETELQDVLDVLRRLPGVTGIVLTMQSLRLTFDPERFQESALESALRRAGPHQITARIPTQVVDPSRGRSLERP